MKPRLYLVDAHAFLHRAYHALPPLANSKGEPVGALYGFARMLWQLLRKEKPDAVAVCFDHPGPSFRHKLYPQYKATRREVDEDLLSQLKRAREMAETMGFACVEREGYEADDLMASLARRSAREGFEAVLVTGDKDALQLVGPGIRVLKDVASSSWMDPPQVEEKLGVPPSLVVDYLALVGDAADNVPGVRGIGPVGAAKLLKRYGGLKAALKAAKAGDPEIPARTASALAAAEKTALAAAELLELDEEVALSLGPRDCRLPEPDRGRLKALFARLEFQSLLKDLEPSAPGRAGTPPPAAERVESRAPSAGFCEVSLRELGRELLEAPAVILAAVKRRGDLLDASRAQLALGLTDGRVAFLEEAEARAEQAALRNILQGRSLKVGYGLKETMAVLEFLGLKLGGPLFDTMIAAYCLNPVRAKELPPANGDKRSALLGRLGRALGHQDLKAAMEDAGVLKLFEEVEIPVIAILRDMESRGIALDEPYLRRLSAEFEGEIAALKVRLDGLAGREINVNSPKQLSELLYDRLGLPVIHKTAKGGRSTDEGCLKALAAVHPLPAKVLEYRELTKLKSTYIEGLLDRLDHATGRVHTRFEQTGTETGRLSSLNPNLQNIPIRSPLGQKIRRAFVASPGYALVCADYSQIDLRVLAHVSQDQGLRAAFLNNEDIHLRTACEIFHVPPESVDAEMRRRAKAVNFGIVYGQTAFGLAAELGIPQGEAAAVIRKYFERYQGVARWIESNLAAARRQGEVRTFLGRLRHLPELAAKNTAVRQFAERAARNTPIQGGSADVIKLAMLRVQEELSRRRSGARMLLQIHDELLFEVPEGEVSALAGWARRSMEEAVSLSVPLVVDVKTGPNWQDMERLTAERGRARDNAPKRRLRDPSARGERRRP